MRDTAEMTFGFPKLKWLQLTDEVGKLVYDFHATRVRDRSGVRPNYAIVYVTAINT